MNTRSNRSNPSNPFSRLPFRRFPARLAAASAAILALLAAAFIIGPATARPAEAQGLDPVVLPIVAILHTQNELPATPTNLRGSYTIYDRSGLSMVAWHVFTDWDAGASGTTLCLPTCTFYTTHGETDNYVVEWRQPEQTNHRGYFIDGAFDWTELATVTTNRYDYVPVRGPDRRVEYRVKACNEHGCSAWSNTLTLTVGYQ